MSGQKPSSERVSLQSFHPSKGMYCPEEAASFLLELTVSSEVDAVLELEIFKNAEVIFSKEWAVQLEEGKSLLSLDWKPAENAYGGFGVELSLCVSGCNLLKASTAVDIHDSWIEFPRYGFLMDFSPHRDIPSFEWLKQNHINCLQFYDWQFRHDTLLADADRYLDPFEREMSLETIRSLIASAHEAGMAAMPYLAVYAASLDFWRAHPEWALYDEKGDPLTFHDFLGYMDPSPGGGWEQHLLRECARVDDRLDFDGFHVDQYGEPKLAWNSKGAQVDLPGAFRTFIAALKETSIGKPVVFNAVGNWPIEELAASDVDFVYIEIWPPDTRYEDLADIVQESKRLSNGKPVVIALYIPSDRPVNLRLAEAILFANGASHILLGEEGLLLTDPYFPKSDPVPKDTETWLRRYWDFLIRYQGLLGPGAAHVSGQRYDVGSEDVLLYVRRKGSVEFVQLINFSGIDQKEWNREHHAPDLLKGLNLSVHNAGPVECVMAASPDSDNPGMVPVVWEVVDGTLMIEIPECVYWTCVYIKYSDLEHV